VKLERFVHERSAGWEELDELIGRAGARGDRLDPTDICRLAALYRSASADLALARRISLAASGTARLESLVLRAYVIVYGKADRAESAWQFLNRGLWRQIRANIGNVGISASILFGGLLLGVIWALAEPATAVGLLPSSFHASTQTGNGGFYGISIAARGGLAASIFVNNIEVACLALAGGFTFGLMTAFSLAYNGALIGVLGALEWKSGGFDQFVRLVVPHGLLELSCIILAGSCGVAVARALIDPGRSTRSTALANLVPRLGACLLGAMTFLVVAGITEGVVTPWDLPTPVALSVGGVLAGTFWALVIIRGRPLQASMLLEPDVGGHARRSEALRRRFDHSRPGGLEKAGGAGA
jgi:uncharacterized membrane protein SpoIIM required for sporulation